MSYDVVLTGTPPATITAHTPGCPAIDLLRNMGMPLMTLVDCDGTLPADVERHDCFTDS